MDEAADDRAAKLGYTQEANFKERRLVPQKVFYSTNTGDTRNSKFDQIR